MALENVLNDKPKSKSGDRKLFSSQLHGWGVYCLSAWLPILTIIYQQLQTIMLLAIIPISSNNWDKQGSKALHIARTGMFMHVHYISHYKM